MDINRIMPNIISSVGREYAKAYSGADLSKIGLGLANPNIYATPDYQKKKIDSLAIGLISNITYAGAEHDRMPLILPIVHESSYNTILAYNLNYIPSHVRRAIVKFIIDSNAARIRSNQPLMVDYHAVKRAVKESQYIVRRYKQVGINLIETYPLVEIPNIIDEQSRWSNHYRVLARSS